MRSIPFDVAGIWSTAPPSELALVGELEMLLRGPDELDALDGALERLREGSGATVSELFLAAPDGREVFLVSHQGPDLEAFCRRDRFDAGEGFPGIVLSTAASVTTTQLSAEQDFLRSRVKALGYTSVLCTPLGPGTDVSGSILLAWKGPPRDMAGALRLAALASVPIGVATDLMRAHLRTHQLQHIATHGGAPLEGNGHPLLLFPRSNEHAPECPARRTNQVQVLGGRRGWPTCCREAGCTAPARYCIPLLRDAQIWAVATTVLHDQPPVPHTRFLPAALWLTEDLIPSDGHDALPTGMVKSRPIGEARLRIKCFGGFTISVDGKLVEPSQMGRQKARELLALLVSTVGRPKSLEYLAQQLWPNVPLDRARNRFHVTLSSLRRVLEHTDSNSVPHIRREGQRYSLDPDSSVFVDLWHFHQLVRDAAVAKRHIERELALLEEALALYSGELFAGEFAEGWHHDDVASARERALQVVGDLAEARLKCSQVSQALAILRRANEISPRTAQTDPRLLMLRSACLQRQTPPTDRDVTGS